MRPSLPSLLMMALALAASPLAAQRDLVPRVEEPRRHYVVYRTPAPPTIDGAPGETSWAAAPWTEDFLDIEGARSPVPPVRTRAKLLWDDRCLYIAAELEEPDVWGTVMRRDDVVFRDPDFEVFLDPDGDTHAYYELELNALGTVWDLLLTAPYRDGGIPLDHWDVRGLRYAVRVNGTLNRPGDRDHGWTLELALPWEALAEAAPGRRPPRPGEQWRLNFSRVEWDVDVVGGRYRKRTDAAGSPLPEHNWSWSPQGGINMHMPERWGFLQFSGRVAGAGQDAYLADPDLPALDLLRRLYYAQRRQRAATGRYAAKLGALGLGADTLAGGHAPELQVTADLFQARLPGSAGGSLFIRQDGRTWKEVAPSASGKPGR